MDEPIVATRDLTRRFGRFVAVDGVTFDVAPGEVFGFLGPNGAGKSTTIRMLCGIISPSGGDATVAGHDVRADPEGVKSSIGYMSQRFSLYSDLTVSENLEFYAGVYGLDTGTIRRVVGETIERAGLGEYRNRLASDLPVGHRQRLALAAALMHNPPVLFLDEPTSGVDPEVRRSFWRIIRDLADRGTTVFVTTHAMDEAEHCDRLAFIIRGKLIALGTPEELRRSYPGVILHVQTESALKAIAVVADLPSVEDVALFGAGLHVVVRDSSASEIIVRALDEAGVRAEAPRVAAPTMEDVFVRFSRSIS